MRGARIGAALAALAMVGALATARADQAVGTTFPDDFPVITDSWLGFPVIGFGASGSVERVPVIFLHGNNDTPFPTTCNGAFGEIHNMAQFFHDNGYALSELWGLGYQGDQCDLVTTPTNKSGPGHSTEENVDDLRRFVRAILKYTGAERVDIVGHSLGTTLAREWMRQDDATDVVRALVGVDGPNHGIINCSPDPGNYFAHDALGGFNPDSAICREYGSPKTPLLRRLNKGDETPGPTTYLMIVNSDQSFVYFAEQDGVFPPAPEQDRAGNPHDFSRSARLKGATNVEVAGQWIYDDTLLTSHLGIINSPEVWQIAFKFLTDL